MYCIDYKKGMEQVCEKSTHFRDAVCILLMVARGGEGGVTGAPLKKHESRSITNLDGLE